MIEPQAPSFLARNAGPLGLGGAGGFLGLLVLLFKDRLGEIFRDMREERVAKRQAQISEASGKTKFEEKLLETITVSQDKALAIVRKELDDRFEMEKRSMSVHEKNALSLENITASIRAQTQKLDTIEKDVIQIKGAVSRGSA